MHPRDETAMERPLDDHRGEEEDPFADYDSEKEEDRRMDDGGRSGGDSAEFAGNPAKEICRHVISTEGQSGSADLSVEAGTGTGVGTVQGCAPDPDPDWDNTQQSSEDMTVDETGDETSRGQGGVPAACSTPLRGAESYRIVTIEMPVDRRTENLFPEIVAAAADIENTEVVRGDAHSAGGSDGGQGDANSAGKSGDGNSAESRIVIPEKLAKAISAARKSDAARRGDAAGISDAAAQSDASKSRVPAMVPPAKKKQEKELDAVPSATYKSILAAKVKKITPPTIPGTGKATANLDCGRSRKERCSSWDP
jgi:hypothetical protein